ncbi:MAG: hypothetical protein ACREEM_53460 [Blastocatellia bacterium]
MTPREKKPAPPSQPAPVFALPDSLQIKLEPDARINVTVAAAERPARPLNRWLLRLFLVVAVGCFLWLVLYWKYVKPQVYSDPVILNGSPLSVVVTHPAYIAFGDVIELDLSVANRGAEAFNGQITLIF